MRFGFVPNVFDENAASLMRELGEKLEAEGHEISVPALEAIRAKKALWGVTDEEFGEGLDMVVTIGGDGTVLRAVELTLGDRAPLLCINMGHLGYLNDVQPEDGEAACR